MYVMLFKVSIEKTLNSRQHIGCTVSPWQHKEHYSAACLTLTQFQICVTGRCLHVYVSYKGTQ